MAFVNLIPQQSRTAEALTGSILPPAGSGRLAADVKVTVPAGTFTDPADTITVGIEEGMDASNPQFTNLDPATFDGTRRWRTIAVQTFHGGDQAGSRSGQLVFGTVYAPGDRPGRVRIRANSSRTLTYGVDGQIQDVP